MNRRTFVKTLPALTVLAGTASSFGPEASRPSQDPQPITLPKPQTDGGNGQPNTATMNRDERQ
jgi:hypothetical protein